MKDYVLKSNELVRAVQDLTYKEQGVIYILLSSLYQGEVFDTDIFYEIDIVEYKNIVGLSIVDAFIDLRHTCLNLKNKNIVFIQNEEVILITGWITDILYRKADNFISIKWNPNIIKHISGFTSEEKRKKRSVLGKFTKLNPNIIVCSGSQASIRLYEIIKSYEIVGRIEFNLDILRRLLGIGENIYPLYGSFKARVLNPSIKDMEKIGVYVSILEKKEKKKVVGLVFKFR